MEFCPGVYEHAAVMIDRTPNDVSRSADLLVEAHQKAWETYQHPLIVAGIDVYNIEPEAFGAGVNHPSGHNIPSIAEHPCEEVEELAELELPDIGDSPRIQATLEAGQRLQAACLGAEVLVPICGPLALANGLVGISEVLMGLVEDAEETIQAVEHVLQFQYRYLEAIQQAGLQPLFFESGVTPPLLPAEMFRQYEKPLLATLFARATEMFGQAPGCIIGGDSAPIASDLFATKPGYVIAPSETDQGAFLAARPDAEATHVRINMSATLLVDGDAAAIDAEVERVLGLAKGEENVSIGCGVLPIEARPEVVLRIRELVGLAG